MLSVDEQKRIIAFAHRFQNRSIAAIRHSDYAKEVNNPYYGKTVQDDLRDYVTIIETGIPEIYFRLDTLARDHFIEIMQAEYSEYTKED